jgi:hypothetical protein
MGMSLSTCLFWGVDLGDMQTGSPDWEDWTPAWMRPEGEDGGRDWDPDDHLAGLLGWTDMPWPERAVTRQASGIFSGSDIDRTHPDWIAYEVNRNRRTALLKAADYGCKIDNYGHVEGDLALYVAVTASLVESDAWTCAPVHRGPLDAHTGSTPVIWEHRLTRYLQLLDFPLDKVGPMGWYMTGYYG